MRPRVGFLGVGWIGRHRLAAMVADGAIEAVAVVDPSDESATAALAVAPGAERLASLEAMLAAGLDGLVIATPSAAHAGEAIAALAAGTAVFCQKPLGRSGAEVRAVIDAARAADRLLGVDLSYRFTSGAERIRELIAGGELGRVHAVDLTFHNAYGPDKPWFYDRSLSGGGCVMDLGVHLVDLALWWLGGGRAVSVTSQLSAAGAPLLPGSAATEDFAVATIGLDCGAVVRLACSWKLHAGQDAVIAAAAYGTAGGAELRNVSGSFYNFTAERFRGTARETLTTPPEDWGSRAAVDWARRLAAGERYDRQIEALIEVADILDRIYDGKAEKSSVTSLVNTAAVVNPFG